jgi:hypothetical protein
MVLSAITVGVVSVARNSVSKSIITPLSHEGVSSSPKRMLCEVSRWRTQMSTNVRSLSRVLARFAVG